MGVQARSDCIVGGWKGKVLERVNLLRKFAVGTSDCHREIFSVGRDAAIF